jgi:hypothetical protein
LPNDQTTELFLSLQQESANAIRQKLLEALGSESNDSVRNKIGDAVAEIARQYSEAGSFLIFHLNGVLHWNTSADDNRDTMAGSFRCLINSEHIGAT